MVLLAGLARARGVARFGAVVEDGHAEIRVAAPASARVPRRPTVQPVPAKAQPTCGSVRAIARVRLAPYLSREAFERQLRAIPAVRSAVIVIGDVDYELRLECRDLAHLAIVLSSLRAVRGTEVASTALVLRDVAGLGRRALSAADWGTAPRPRQTRSA
jgi:DNA-binding Lrp family transcriptional regulator